MDRIKSIVAGVDFAPSSSAALRQAMRMASWNRAKLHVVHALDPDLAAELEEALIGVENSLREQLIDEVEKEWREFASDIPGARALPFAVDVDNPVASLEKRANLHNADLLVLGMNGSSNSGPGAGTLASALVRRASCKVLLVRDSHQGAFKNVVACIDFSETSSLALSQAVRVALQDEAFLHVIHVFEMPWKRLRRPQLSGEEIEDRWRKALPIRLRDFAAEHEHEMSYIKPEFAVIEDPNHGQAIARYAQDLVAPLVVLGTRGRTSLHDLLVGSTAERVVRDAPCSILAIRPT